ncbi:glycosyltransferase 87 family protein [Actinoplanes rectilineatus]|uniref:glycosyltransferase 87 family protein n=1 Tax=Actinoplanes rectilineatus TaxID=113571 RepID=UPI0009F8F870|nr:glycosyltransferase 87 family protein [Actinoplanes rectilineatus]
MRATTRWAPALTVAVVAGAVALSRPEAGRLTDLQVYAGAVDTLRHGGDLYDYIRNGNAPFTYPPFAALLLLPLAWLPAFPLHLAWTVGVAAAAIALALLVDRRRAPLIATALLLSAPVSSTFKYGQISLLLALLVAADVLALRRSRRQGVLIGLAAAVKLTPLIFIPMLWLTGRRRAAGIATATFLTCAALAAAVLPQESLRYWLTEMHNVPRLGAITSVGNQSLDGALMRLDVPHHATVALLLAGAVAAVALRRTAGPRTDEHTDLLRCLIVTGAAAVVLSPVSWTHHQVWLVLAAALPLAPGIRIGVLAIMLLPVTAIDWLPLRESRLLLAVALALFLPWATRWAPPGNTGRQQPGGLPGSRTWWQRVAYASGGTPYPATSGTGSSGSSAARSSRPSPRPAGSPPAPPTGFAPRTGAAPS